MLGGSAIPQPHDLVDTGLIPEPATSSARIITMDHDAIICFMTDRLTRYRYRLPWPERGQHQSTLLVV